MKKRCGASPSASSSACGAGSGVTGAALRRGGEQSDARAGSVPGAIGGTATTTRLRCGARFSVLLWEEVRNRGDDDGLLPSREKEVRVQELVHQRDVMGGGGASAKPEHGTDPYEVLLVEIQKECVGVGGRGLVHGGF